MTALVVIQARMGSSRLPGKVLAELAGTTVLGFMLDRLRPLRDRATVVVATSAGDIDDAIVPEAGRHGVAVVRGPEEDVLGRYALALETHRADTVVRLTADCPLMDPAVVTHVLSVHQESGADYTSNTLVRTYPDGLDVEAIEADALRVAAETATDPLEREHVTPFIIRRPERFDLVGVRSQRGDFSRLRWTVDTAEDLARVRSIVEGVGNSTFSWTDALSVAELPKPPDAGTVQLVAAPRAGAGDILTDDLARRRWVAEDHRAVYGMVEVAVRSAVGDVRLDLDKTEAVLTERVLVATQRALGSQVASLRAWVPSDDAKTMEGFRRAGFRRVADHGAGVVVEWSRSGG